MCVCVCVCVMYICMYLWTARDAADLHASKQPVDVDSEPSRKHELSHRVRHHWQSASSSGAHFTYFPGTKVQILTLRMYVVEQPLDIVEQGTFRILRYLRNLARYSVYLLYWYKSTNVDSAVLGISESTHALDLSDV